MSTKIQEQLRFTLEDIHKTAQVILQADPDPIPRQRLLREVLRLSDSQLELNHNCKLVRKSQWVRQLEQSQLEDGSWGRFHTQDTKVKTIFRTSEEAIDRAFALGMATSDPPLAHAKRYIENVLTGEAHISDWTEKNDSFPVMIKHILAGRLAQIDPHNNLLEAYWNDSVEIAHQSFSSGGYRLEDEVNAYLRLYGIHVPRGYLISQYSLWILSSRKLPPTLDRTLVNWAWQAPHGIGYLGVPLAHPRLDQLPYWLRSMNLLARFQSWRDLSASAANWLWDQREESGLWKFTRVKFTTIDFPLSDSWRMKNARQMDIATSILAVLRKYFD